MSDPTTPVPIPAPGSACAAADALDDHVARPARRQLLGSIGRSVAALAVTGATGIAPSLAAGPASVGSHAAEPFDLGDAVVLERKRLDEIAASFYPVFNEGAFLPAYEAQRHAARFDVVLRRISTYMTVPETGRRVRISGLLAVPRGVKGALPLVSWQHGTILSFDQVPSALVRLAEPGYQLRDNVDSIETLFNLHRLAGQGYAVIAADYLGKGPYRGSDVEAYLVKDASARCSADMLHAGIAALKSLGLESSALFLNGWSQGALNTQWLSLELQQRGVHVDAVAAQSPFNDLPNSLRYFAGSLSFASPKGHPYPALPIWATPCLIIALGSYSHYYRLPKLMEAAVRPEHLELARTYWRDYTLPPAMLKRLPAPHQLLIDGFFDRYTQDVNSEFLRRTASNSTTFAMHRAPSAFYYGLADQAVNPELVKLMLASTGAVTHGVAVPGASHRGTFLASLYGHGSALSGADDVPSWFGSFSRA